MSDKLSDLLIEASQSAAKPEEPHEERLFKAMEKALKNTTIHKAGTPWDDEGEDNGRRRQSGIVLRSTD